MRFILPENLKFVKRFIEKTFFGALKLHDTELTQDRFLVETVFVDANQYLWCCCAEELPVETDKFPVSLKYVDKVKGIYMKITGIASRVNPNLEPGSEVALDHAVNELTGDKLTLLKVKMTETVYYKKNNGDINFYAVAS
ncbi:MAG: hypothetical protein J7621_16395 [Niastella sp.]|nr:hypothetical protein [Niastella sp.]